MGGGKTSVKSRTYVLFLVFTLFFYNNFVNASVKNDKVKSRKMASSVKKVDNDNLPECPVSMILNRVVDKSLGGTVFYMGKKRRCVLSNNVSVRKWNKSNIRFYPKSLKVLPLWIPEQSAFYLVCNSGYVEKTVDRVKTCVNVSEICPLDEIIEKSGNDYLHPFTNEICVEPENAMIRNVWGEENVRSSTIADKNAFLFECPPNYYSVEHDNNFLRVECEACPSGFSSVKGSKSKDDCVKLSSCASGKILVRLENGNTECRACDEKGASYNSLTESCDIKEGYVCKESGTVCTKKNSFDGLKDIITVVFSIVCGLFMGGGKKIFGKLSTIFGFLSDMKD